MAKRWTKAEERALKRYSSKMSIGELAKKFGVSTVEVRKKEKNLGIIREHPGRKKVKKKVLIPPTKKWTGKEEQYLKDHFEKMTNVELAKKFRTTAKSVESKLRRIGLSRKRKSVVSGEEERRRRVEEILRARDKRLNEEITVGENRRGEAIAQFDQAVQLYYAKKYKQAEAAFGKVIKNFGNVIDVVCKAKRYMQLCQEPS